MTTIHSTTPQELQQWLEAGEALLIDVREPDEFEQERIPHAVNIPLSSVKPQALPPLNQHRLVMHCSSGNRSSEAAHQVAESEEAATDIWNLEGGITAWKDAQLPTLRGTAQHLPLARQVQVTVGALVVTGTLLGAWVHPAWLLLPAMVGLGLMNAGITGWCGMAKALQHMPWNR